MKAAVYTQYGAPEVVQIKEIEIPTPKTNEVLVKVCASTINRTDSGFRSAEYFISRFWSGLFKPKHKVLGSEFAGIITEIGNEVTSFKIGDKVFGFNDKTWGGHAEYLTINEKEAISLIPNNLSFIEAAPICEGAHYALNNIKAANVKKGDNVMVYGATGAIGSAAVQLLKYFGANITAVCNNKNVELIKSLGADLVVDYETQDFTKTNILYNFIFDAVGKSSFKKCKPLLVSNGIYISTELGKNGENVFYALFTSKSKGKKVLFPIPVINKEIVEFLGKLVTEGKFKPIIDRAYKLEQIIEAYHYVETGQKTGNVVLKIAE
jgi:NADPH:quinone reductase-like Zn-dependent oxidoreductase